MTSSSNSFQSTRPKGRVLWEELLVLSRFHLRVEFLPPAHAICGKANRKYRISIEKYHVQTLLDYEIDILKV